MNTFHIVNLGCKVNRVESDTFSQTLENQGFRQGDISTADIIVINTCTVTGEADKKTRKAVNHALRENNHATLFITGCAAAINPDYFTKLDSRVRVIGKADMLSELKTLTQLYPAPNPERIPLHKQTAQTKDPQGSTLETQPHSATNASQYPTRVGVKVQDGCNHACTYCIIHVARGTATSRSFADIIKECTQLIKQNVKEIVLTGINLGSYNDSGRTLADLLRQLIAVAQQNSLPDEPACRFRISSVEPMDIDDDLINLIATSDGQICRHLHLPLQSGSSKVLSEMNRPYTAEEFLALVAQLRQAIPTLSLSTDIIVGFPGETDEDFAKTVEVAEQCAFSKIHVFPYSQRQGTPAAARPDQIDPQIKRQRAQTLRNLGKTLRQADWDHRLNTTEFAIVEERGIAMTESHFELKAPSGILTGSLIPLQLKNEILQDSQF